MHYNHRIGKVERETKETKVAITIDIDGSGSYKFPIIGDVDLRESSPLFYLNHGLNSLVVWGYQDLTGQLDILDKSYHHAYEDTALVLGRALKKTFGDKHGISRVASFRLPFEGSGAEVAIDLSGRPYLDMITEIRDSHLEEMISHFLKSLSTEAEIDMYARLYGKDDHHQIEAVLKCLGRSIYHATRFLESRKRDVISTKGKLE